jgi:hypothetical protein
MKTKQNNRAILVIHGHVSSNEYITRAKANEIFQSNVKTWNLIAFDPDPSGYRYAHNEDLTIRCWIEKITMAK